MGDINREDFGSFTVYSVDEDFSFIHLNIDEDHFYQDMFDYFFSADRLLKYAENRSNLKFEPTTINYVTLFKLLEGFIDEENVELPIEDFEESIREIILNEYKFKKNEVGDLKIRLDKIGKIGEYVFSVLLWEFFQFDCIIPKVHLSTSRNMSVYGIDTLFYSIEDELILFGESKVSRSLDNGISLIKSSLNKYEQQIKDEFKIVLSSRIFGNRLEVFTEKYGALVEQCISIEEFFELAKITKIGVPIFIAHGEDDCPETIFEKLSKIPKKKLLNLDTKYIVISVPIISKEKMVVTFTESIRRRRSEYESARKSC